MPRLFVAVPVPRDVAVVLAALLPDTRSLRRVEADLLHLTLAFVGSAPEERVSQVVEAAASAAGRCAPFTVRFEELGRFPDAGPPRTVWAGTIAGAPRLEELSRAVREELARRAVPFDPKPFRAHVTLARLREGGSTADVATTGKALRAARIPDRLGFAVDAVHVVESVLTPRGPRYSSRARAALQQWAKVRSK